MPAIPLSTRLPLRTTAAWGQFSELKAIPWVYGRVSLMPVQYDDQRRQFVLADHPILAITRLARDDVASAAYRWSNTQDNTGHAVALLELGEPLAENERLAVSVQGKRHPRTGELLENPADVVWDLLANLAGIPIEAGDLEAFRGECAAWKLTVGGVVDDPTQTIRGALDNLLSSLGAVWSGGMSGWARLWPTSLS